MDSFGIGDAYPPPGSSSSLVVRLVAHLLSQVSYRLCVTCLILVPVTHLLNVLLSELLSRGPAKERSFIRRALLLNGGKRHQAFSCCGWVSDCTQDLFKRWELTHGENGYEFTRKHWSMNLCCYIKAQALLLDAFSCNPKPINCAGAVGALHPNLSPRVDNVLLSPAA